MSPLYPRRPLQKAVAAVLSFVLLFTQVLFAHAVERTVWQERSRNASSFIPSQVLPLKKMESNVITPFLPTSRSLNSLVSVLSKNGVIRDIKAGENPGTIVYIQDVHGQLEAQKNISSMISTLLAMEPRVVVGVEGAAGSIPMSTFRQSSARINQEIGSFFLNTGLITGAEHAGFVSPNSPELFGVEDPSLYLHDVAALRDALAYQGTCLKNLDAERDRLQRQKQDHYSKQMLALDELGRSYQAGHIHIGDYLSGLAAIGVNP